jgi:outer membrane protein assembly factor BamB
MIAAWALFYLVCPTAARAQSAQDILDAVGVQGGLVVCVGLSDGALTAGLSVDEQYLVHGLDTDPAKVAAARAHIFSLGLYGQVAVETFDGLSLPYADNLANLVVSEDLGSVPMGEVTRVLCPGGVAYIKNGATWDKTVKPRPAGLDEWTHALHAPDNNAVSSDTLVNVPYHVQWRGLPRFDRNHEQLARISACIGAGGRIFYILDKTSESDNRLPSEWSVVARDAYNGVALWEREMGDWVNQFRRFRSGPANLPTRLVADDTRVFATLDYGAPVAVLDAATGETIQTIADTENAKQIIQLDADTLILLIDDEIGMVDEIDEARRRGEYIDHHCRIAKVDLTTGAKDWETSIDEFVFPCTAVRNGRVFAQTPTTLYCLDLSDGSESWSKPFAAELPIPLNKRDNGEVQWESPTLVAYEDIVFSADFNKIKAYAAADGTELWQGVSKEGYNAPADAFVMDGLIWVENSATLRDGLNPLTGAIERQWPVEKGYMHSRCHRNRGVGRTMLLGDMGVQFVDVQTGDIRRLDWVRGTCQIGVMPANGMLYAPPHSCACNAKTKLNGFYALAPKQPGDGAAGKTRRAPRIQYGPAYGAGATRKPQAENPDDWPIHRHDAERSGIATTSVPHQLIRAWRTEIGGRLSGVVCADGRLFVASIDTHTVHALDAVTGAPLWRYTVGGRVDSPPTIYNGMALFGSADGWVYALDAANGSLVWRFRGAPEERWVCIDGQLESAWPIPGSVLIKDGVLYASAGRSTYLDGGIYVYRLDPATGAEVSPVVDIFSPDPVTLKPPTNAADMYGVQNDILATDGQDVYIRHMKVDFAGGDQTLTGTHLFAPTGLLDGTWWHRTYWVVYHEFIHQFSGWDDVGNQEPSGRILSYNDNFIYGYGRDKYPGGNTGQWRGGEKYQLFAVDRATGIIWEKEVPLFGRALAVAGQNIFVAGQPDFIETVGDSGEEALMLLDPELVHAAWGGEYGGLLWAVSVADGEKRAAFLLEAPPVFDGLIAAAGRLYLALSNGEVISFEEGVSSSGGPWVHY